MIILILILILVYSIYTNITGGGEINTDIFAEETFDFNDLKTAEKQGFTIIKNVNNNKIILQKLLKPPFDNKKFYHFPYLKYYLTPIDIIQLFTELTNCKLIIEKYKNVPQDLEDSLLKKSSRVNSDCLFKGFNLNEYILLRDLYEIKINNNFYPGSTLVDYFQEYNRYICKRNDSDNNLIEKFNKNKSKLAKLILTDYKNLKKHNTRIYIPKHLGILPCSEFDPHFLIYIINFFKQYIDIKNVLDMSIGRGSRMLAAMSQGLNYTGTDPNTNTNATCVIMRDFFMNLPQCKNLDIELITSGFEEPWENNIKLKPYDIMFTSPPYFDLELFSDNNTQSVIKFSGLQNWLENFLKVCMIKIIKLLRIGGIMAFNIDNSVSTKQTNDYINPMLNFNIPGATYIGVITIKRFGKAYYSTWCWQKNI